MRTNPTSVPGKSAEDRPLIAVFADAARADSALARVAARLVSRPAPGTLVLRGTRRCAAELYAAGARLVIG
jgi:hypothetical protein